MADRGFTYSEQYRLECLARYIAALPTSARRAKFLDDMEKIHGQKPIVDLRELVRAEWKKLKGGASATTGSAKQNTLF